MLLKRYAAIATSTDKRDAYLVIHPSPLSRPTLIEKFSNLREVKSTTSLVKTPCLVCLVPSRSHSKVLNDVLVPYVVGMHPNSPKNPHSAMASGGNNISDIDNSPPVEAYTLYGAVVGGPDKQDMYYDIRNNWAQTEVRLLSAAQFLMIHCNHSAGRHRL